jgi:hypothetical protein
MNVLHLAVVSWLAMPVCGVSHVAILIARLAGIYSPRGAGH